MNECYERMTMQGDQYLLPIEIEVDDKPINIEDFKQIQFKVGNLLKYWNHDQDSEVIYIDGKFLFPLSQQETFNFRGQQEIQIRLQDYQNNIVGKRYGSIDVMNSLTKEEM